MDWLASTSAVAIGATAVERHFTTSRDLMGFDHKISLEPQMFKSMVDDIRRIEILIGDKIIRDLFDYEKVTKNKYHVSMISSRDIKVGEVLTENDICWKNPGTGLMPKDSDLVLGKKLKVDILKDTLIKLEFLNRHIIYSIFLIISFNQLVNSHDFEQYILQAEQLENIKILAH